MDYGRWSLADALAAAYVAGTLRGAARRRFDALLPAHPALRAAVAQWEARLTPLVQVIEPVSPPARVWRAIEQRLWPAPPVLPWWHRVAVWRGVSGAATAAVLALVLVGTPAPTSSPPIIVVLQSTGSLPAAGGIFVASLSGDGLALVTRPVMPVSLEDSRVLELWSVPPQGAPVSLGLISSSGTTVVPPPRLAQGLVRGQAATLAVSVEPTGGSPTGAPTGPVVYAGALRL